MSGEPKTLTLIGTLVYDAESMHSGDADPSSRVWFLEEVLGGDHLVLHDNGDLGDEVGRLIGVRVVALDEAAELREAVREWVAADAAYSEWMVLPVREDWTSGEAKARRERLEAAEAVLRRFAGGENEK